MHRLTSGFVLGYHGCDKETGESLLRGDRPKPSNNAYDWLGPGVYFWESNPLRGLQFAEETAKRRVNKITTPFVIGAAIDPGNCLDLTTSSGVVWIRRAYESLRSVTEAMDGQLPRNSENGLLRNLDCAVISRLHQIRAELMLPAVDTVRGLFVEGEPVYPGAGIAEKTHTQIAVCNPACIKGVFRVYPEYLAP